MHKYVISIVSHNTLSVLQRVAGTFSRYRVNIEHINAYRCNNNLSHWQINIHSEKKTIQMVINQLEKIVELVEVKITEFKENEVN